MSPLLEIRDLEIVFPAANEPTRPVRGLSLSVERGEIVGLVGESGSGKSLTAMAALGLLPPPGAIAAGSVRFDGRELADLGEEELRRLRGGGIGYLPQEPASALNPVVTCGIQITEVVRAHRQVGRLAARLDALALLRSVGFERPDEIHSRFPGELSGGQRQRVLLAAALAGDPELLIADEPTASLDDLLAVEVLELLAGERRRRGRSVLLVTHDLRSVVGICDRVYVAYCGEVVEVAAVETLRGRAVHPYTRALLALLPEADEDPVRGLLPTIPGQVPAPGALPGGCAFHPRCEERLDECSNRVPPWRELSGPNQGVRCVLEAGR